MGNAYSRKPWHKGQAEEYTSKSYARKGDRKYQTKKFKVQRLQK